MNKKTTIAIALVLGVLIGFLVTMMCGYTSAPDTGRIAISTLAKPTGVMLSEEAWERLEELLDAQMYPP